MYNDPRTPVSPAVFEVNNKALQEGIDKVFDDPEFGKKNQAFVDEFKRNTSVWAAFKSHSQTQAMIDALYDEDGNIISFWAWKKKVKPIIGKYNEEWLRTEYNTAVRAARAAVNYRQALETKDLYPNLEYLESTAHEKRLDHLGYVGTVLPIDHPWWDDHLPPSEWNCQCSVRPTDKPETVVPLDDDPIRPTFRNNPGKTAQPIKLAEHPYIQHHALSQCPECIRQGFVPSDGKEGEYCPSHRIVLEREFEDYAKKIIQTYLSVRRSISGFMIVSQIDNTVKEHLAQRGIVLDNDDIVTSSDIVIKYINHPKSKKNAVVPVEDLGIVRRAILSPSEIYVQVMQKGSGNYVFVTPYDDDRVIKAVVHISYKYGKTKINFLKSWGIIKREDLNSSLFEKIK